MRGRGCDAFRSQRASAERLDRGYENEGREL